MQYVGAISKMTEWSVSFQDKPFNITVIRVYTQSLMPKKLKLNVLWRPKRPSRTNTIKRCPFLHGDLEGKSRKSRYTWSNRQVWPWSTKWSRTKANRVFSIENTGHSKHPFPVTKDDSTHGHPKWDEVRLINTEVRLIIIFIAENGEALYSQ